VIGLKDKWRFNAGVPSNDAAVFLNYVIYPTFPAIISGLFVGAINDQFGTTYATLAPTNFPRYDLANIFLFGLPTVNQITTSVGGEVLRLNTSIAPTVQASQSSLGAVGGDFAGFPNGRRPGDDVVDIELQALMGALCWLFPNTIISQCNTTYAVVGNVAFTDGAPNSALNFQNAFPYLNTPHPGSTGVTNSPASTLSVPFFISFFLSFF